MESILGTESSLAHAGTRTVSLTFMGSELVNIIYDVRWMLLAVVVCIIVDFRLGWRESQEHYAEAKEKNDPIMLMKYGWHPSRAMRKSIQKLLDYFCFICFGVVVGMAVIQPLGYPYIFGGVAACAVAILCETCSIFGHFFYLHGINIESHTVTGFLKGLAIGFAKSKSPDIGEGLERGFKEAEKIEKKKGGEA